MMIVRASSLAVGLAFTAVALFPMRLAWSALPAQPDVKIGDISGTVWASRLSDVAWRGVLLGDFVATSDLLAKPGTLVFRLRSSNGPLQSATLAGSDASLRLEQVAGVFSFPLASGGANASVEARVTDASFEFDGEACRSASGQVTVTALAELPIPAFEGSLACTHGSLQASLTAANNVHRVVVAFAPNTGRSAISVVSATPQVALWLAALGFSLPTSGSES